MYHEKTLLCLGCARPFAFSAGEQELSGELGHDTPTRCPACQQLREDRLRVPELITDATDSDAARQQIAEVLAASTPVDTHYAGRSREERHHEREASFGGTRARGSAGYGSNRRPTIAGSGHRG